MPRLLLEVIVQTVEDARAATEGGADRLEVVRAIRDGGLTPSMETVRDIRGATSLPLRVMVRENPGYTTSAEELDTLRAAAKDLSAIGVDGIVLGYARDGVLALGDVVGVLEAAPDMKATFHRAFDVLRDPLVAIDMLSEIPQIDRILTNGGDGPAAVRCARLHRYSMRARNRFAIVAGGGVDEQGLTLFARTECVGEVHVGRAARQDGNPEAPVCLARVQHLRQLAG